ncbi:MAG: flagellar hook-associated protein FlgK [Phycisphaeraceae bacterium]|nr:MAG: flagellar hook-associated protein FlgK [Phycisphaeraceae bacterium]
MSLSNSLLIGRSALTASQLAIQVTGDNLANAATPGYHRRVATLTPAGGSVSATNIYQGRGVEVESVLRQLDPALQSRIRNSLAEHNAARIEQDVLAQIEHIVSDLNGRGLSSELDAFFNAFSELANRPGASETRSLIIEQGATLAQFTRQLRNDLVSQRQQIDAQITSRVKRADELLREIARLNREVVTSEQGRTEDAGLRDQRDALVNELSELIGVSVIEQASGAIDVHVGSTPVVLGDIARGLETRQRTIGDEVVTEVYIRQNEERLVPRSGQVGALLKQRDGIVNGTIDSLDRLASNLIFEVNKLHSSGRSFPGLTETTGAMRVAAADMNRSFNDPDNNSFANLPYQPSNGSFVVYVTDKATGITEKHEIFVSLTGIDNTGQPGFADDTTLDSLIADLDGLGNLSASILPSGEVRLVSDAGFEFGFADDTTGTLAALGINTFFTGTSASDIGVRKQLQESPHLLVAGLEPGTNEAALAIANLRESSIDALGGATLRESWAQTIEKVSVQSRGATTRAQAAEQVRHSLEAQRAAVSGVSIDEESINLLNYQRQYQAAARFISTVDELTQLLIALV